MSQARIIVVGNEKGGAGKSTVAIHLAAALLHAGQRVAVIDLDLRQQSLGRFCASRRAWRASSGVDLPMPFEPGRDDPRTGPALADENERIAMFESLLEQSLGAADVVLIDTPGGHTNLSRAAHARADQIVTPMNDSFVDFDLLGQVDPVTLNLLKPSIYSETVWEARKQKAATRGTIDWVVLSNRLASTEARNRKRLDERMTALAKRVGFRMIPGLRDRVIYRELFPFGLTVADLSSNVRPIPVALSHVAARQELRALVAALGLSDQAGAAERIAS